ncbi:MAG: damage-control phosphatase ARMT1 family protein [Thermodesulfovibrionales bacterium]
MNVHLDCFPCFLRQVIIALRYGTKDKDLQELILKAVLNDVKLTDTNRAPAYTTTFIHRRIRAMLGSDPFKDIKSEYNRIALGLYPSLKRIVNESTDPLYTASRLAIAGNIIDFGIFTSVDIEASIERALNNPLSIDDYTALKLAIEKGKKILYLLDNAGEIIFDRVLIETLVSLGTQVTAVVKGSPVINDCTIDDAIEAGLNSVCEVIDNGSDGVGTILELTSSDFRRYFERADLIISKGQGNYETLHEVKRDKTIFYLFQSKCEVVSKEVGLSLGSMILSKS